MHVDHLLILRIRPEYDVGAAQWGASALAGVGENGFSREIEVCRRQKLLLAHVAQPRHPVKPRHLCDVPKEPPVR